MKHQQIQPHRDKPLSLEELRLLVWTLWTLFIIGPRACGKSTIGKVLTLLAGPLLHFGDSSDNISCTDPKKRGGLVEVHPDCFETQQLLATASNRAAGGLMDPNAAVTANIVMMSQDLKKMPRATRVVLAGAIREPEQARRFMELFGQSKFKTVFINSSFVETVIGSFARTKRNPGARLDNTPASIVKAWLTFKGPIKNSVNLLKEKMPGSIIPLNKSDDPLTKMDVIVEALDVGHGIKTHWHECLRSDKHPAGRLIQDLRREIAGEWQLIKEAGPLIGQCEHLLDTHKEHAHHPSAVREMVLESASMFPHPPEAQAPGSASVQA